LSNCSPIALGQFKYATQFVSNINILKLLLFFHLQHLCDDYDLYGPLDNCSTFVFENYL